MPGKAIKPTESERERSMYNSFLLIIKMRNGKVLLQFFYYYNSSKKKYPTKQVTAVR